jgi:hypothetical protein
VVWHCLAAVLLYSVIRRLLSGKEDTSETDVTKVQPIALIGALAFALNPIVSEVVCWAKSLDDLMATVLVLASLRSLLKYKGEVRDYGMALAWFAAAVYSKESVVPFPLVALIVLRIINKLSWKRSLVLSGGFMGISLAYMAHRYLVIGQVAQCLPLSGSYGQTLWDMMPVVPMYLRLLCGIPPFCIDYAYMTGHNSWLAGSAWAGVLLLGIYLAAVVWSWGKRPIVLLGLAWLGAFLLPVSNLVPMMQYMAERFLYLPLIGFILVGTELASRLRPARLVGGIGIAVVLIWSLTSMVRSAIWQDEVNLFVHSWQESPRCQRMEDNLVVAIFRLPHLQKLFPIDSRTKKMGSMQQVSVQNLNAAMDTLREARRLLPENTMLSSALGMACAQAGLTREAVEMLELSAKLKPSAEVYFNLGVVQMQYDENEQARATFETALKLDPKHQRVLRYYGQLCRKMQDYDQALLILNKLKNIDPQDKEVQEWIADCERKKLEQDESPKKK